MKLHRSLAALAVVGLVSPILAQDVPDILRNIPEDVLGFAVINRLDQADAKLQGLAKKLQVPIPASPLELAKSQLGITKGLDVKGRAALVLLGAAGKRPLVTVFLVPVTDYQEFAGQFKGKETSGITEIALADGTKMAVAKKDKYAALAPGDNRKLLQKFVASTTNLAAAPASLRNWLEQNDLAIVVTPRGLKTVLEPARGLLAMSKAVGAKPEVPAFVPRWIDSADNFLGSIETEVTHAGLATTIDNGGNVHLELRALFAKSGKLASGAASVKAEKDGPLAGLPAGPYAMAFGGLVSENFMQEMMKVTLEMTKVMAKASGSDIPEAKARKLEQVMAQSSKGLRGMGFLVRGGKEGETLFSGMMGVLRVDNAQAYLIRYEKTIAELNVLYADVGGPLFPKMEFKKMTIGKAPAVELITKLPDLGGQADPIQQKMMEAMFGAGGQMTATLVAAGDTTVLMSYRPAAEMKTVLDAFADRKTGLKNDPDVAGTLAMLPAGSQWVFLIDPRGTTSMVGHMLKRFMPGGPVQVPVFPKTPPIGVGAKVSEAGLVIHTMIPAQFLDNLRKLVPGKTDVSSSTP